MHMFQNLGGIAWAILLWISFQSSSKEGEYFVAPPPEVEDQDDLRRPPTVQVQGEAEGQKGCSTLCKVNHEYFINYLIYLTNILLLSFCPGSGSHSEYRFTLVSHPSTKSSSCASSPTNSSPSSYSVPRNQYLPYKKK